ncbi:MAG: ATP-binding protein [Thermodesulfobacteriota bacterium]
MTLDSRRLFILRAVLVYAVFASFWILLSDALLASFVDTASIHWLSTAKGMFFVLVTSALLFFVLESVPAVFGAASTSSVVDRLLASLTGSPLWAYGFAVAVTGATLLVRAGLAVPFAVRPLMVFLLFPIILSAAIGGLGPGLVATLSSALFTAYFGLAPIGAFAIAGSHDLFQWSFLVTNGVLVSSLCEVLHRLRRQAEARRRQQEVTLASIGDGVITVDAGGGVTYLNPAAERLTGRSCDDALGRPLTELFTVTDEPRRQPIDLWRRVLSAGGALVVADQAILETADGRQLPILQSGSPIRAADGSIQGAVLILHDETERRRQENAVLEERALYQDLVNTQPAGIYRIRVKAGKSWRRDEWQAADDVPYRFEMVSDRFCELLGIDRRELQEDPGIIGRSIHPEDAPEFVRANERANAALSPFRWEGRVVVDGTVKWVHFESLPRRLTDGDVLWTGILYDVTTQKNLEAQFHQAQKIESIGRLAGGVAHDFNNMLMVIGGNAELVLAATDEDDPRYPELRTIQETVQRSAKLTRQLLAFARKQTVSPVLMDLNETLSGSLKMLRRLIGEDIELVLQPGDDPGPVKIDPGQLDQILVNLMVNARDAIAGVGRITIRTAAFVADVASAAVLPDLVPGEYVMLEVVDDGCGMDREVLAHLFEPFFTTKGMGKGTGLGLATVYGIVRQNGGVITVASEVGRGATFTMYFPRAAAAPPRPGEQSGTAALPRGSETVLIVEDDPAILDLAVRLAGRLGYRVLAAGAPEEAIRLVEEKPDPIDLLITDVVMPQMNGRELAARLRRLRPRLKTLFMSGYTADVVARQGILEQGILLLQKPFSIHDLAFGIRRALAREEAGVAAAGS